MTGPAGTWTSVMRLAYPHCSFLLSWFFSFLQDNPFLYFYLQDRTLFFFSVHVLVMNIQREHWPSPSNAAESDQTPWDSVVFAGSFTKPMGNDKAELLRAGR